MELHNLLKQGIKWTRCTYETIVGRLLAQSSGHCQGPGAVWAPSILFSQTKATLTQTCTSQSEDLDGFHSPKRCSLSHSGAPISLGDGKAKCFRCPGRVKMVCSGCLHLHLWVISDTTQRCRWAESFERPAAGDNVTLYMMWRNCTGEYGWHIPAGTCCYRQVFLCGVQHK